MKAQIFPRILAVLVVGVFFSVAFASTACAQKYDPAQAASSPKSNTNRQPFVFTISASCDDEYCENDDDDDDDRPRKAAKKKSVRYMVAVHSVGAYKPNYDLDCNGDGVYEKKGLHGSTTCTYDAGSGLHQIRIRGEVPGIWLCASGYFGWDMMTPEEYKEVICADEDGDGSPDDFRCALPYRMKAVCRPPMPAKGEKPAGYPPPYNWPGTWTKEQKQFCNHELEFSEEQGYRELSVQSIDSWGDVQWKSMQGFAADCKELRTIPADAPDLRHVTDMSGMFWDAVSLDQSLNGWDVSHVEDMSHLFDGASSFSHYPESWTVPEKSAHMFDDTPALGDLPERKPLPVRKSVSPKEPPKVPSEDARIHHVNGKPKPPQKAGGKKPIGNRRPRAIL